MAHIFNNEPRGCTYEDHRKVRRRHSMLVAVKIMVPFWVLRRIRHLYLGDPKGDNNLDNHPCGFRA